METTIGEFRSQGYAILRGVLEKFRIEAARRECGVLVDQVAERLHAEGKIDDLCADEPFGTRLMRLYENRSNEAPRNFRPQLHRSGFFELFAHPRLLDLAEQIVGHEVLLHPTYTARPKLPEHKPTEVPWHQDSGNTAFMLGDDPAAAEVETLRMANMWTPLVAANRHNGCMAFIPGSHRQGVAPHEKGDATTSYTHIADEYTRIVEEARRAHRARPGRCGGLPRPPLPPGPAQPLVLHPLECRVPLSGRHPVDAAPPEGASHPLQSPSRARRPGRRTLGPT